MTDESLDSLVATAYALPWGPAKSAALESAIRRADGPPDTRALAFGLRLELVTSYTQGGERVKALAPFARMVSDFDDDPSIADSVFEFLWTFKFVVDSMYLTPDISVEQTRSVLDDMERRWRLQGLSLHPVLQRRWGLAHHLGAVDEADELYRLWNAAPRDLMSDCRGCDPTWKVWHLVGRERHEEAIELAAPVVAGHHPCHDQPHYILSALLPAYVATGRVKEAASAHQRAYRVLRQRRADLLQIAENVIFLALTGNEFRAVEITRSHLDWLDAPESPAADMAFSAAAALALTRAADRHPDTTVRLGRLRVPGDQVAGELADRALTLASRFDARNGNTHQGDRIRGILHAEPWASQVHL